MNKPFRLETMWCYYPDFINLVKKNWTNKDLLNATTFFEEDIR